MKMSARLSTRNMQNRKITLFHGHVSNGKRGTHASPLIGAPNALPPGLQLDALST